VKVYIKTLEAKLEEHQIPQRVTDLTDWFVQDTATTANINKFNSLYGNFFDLAQASIAKKIGHKKYGYNRSSTLTSVGQMLLLFKHAHCRK
jgi:hypothetical protein